MNVPRLLTSVLFILALAIQASPAAAAPAPASTSSAAPSKFSPRAGTILGMVAPRGVLKASGAGLGTPPLLYHGGQAITGGVTNYAVYWLPSSWSYTSPNYETLINQYFTNVAADSGKPTNVYTTDTEYYDKIVRQNSIQYSQTFGGALIDSDPFPTNGCTDPTHTFTTCITDSQLQTELQSYLTAQSLPADLSHDYFVFFPPNLATCISAAGTECSSNFYCAYHSSLTVGVAATILYANMAYAKSSVARSVGTCDTGSSPNNDDADDTINVTSHESNETITDPLGHAWFDSSGFENGDECDFDFGTPIGTTGSNQAYNQLINGTPYYLQQEWSNQHNTCEENYLPQITTTLSPSAGPTTGGTAVTLAGADFTGTTAVMFGSTPAASFTVNSDTSLTATSPAGTGTVDITITNAAGTSYAYALDQYSYLTITGGRYSALTPARILDTRANSTVGPYSTPFLPGLIRTVQVVGKGGVPAGATAAVLNVTVTDTTAAGYLNVWPSLVSQPLASNLNWVSGQTIPNLVEVAVGGDGNVEIFNSAGLTDVIVDVEGFVGPTGLAKPKAASTGLTGLFNPITPARILDTRSSSQVGPYSTPFGTGVTRLVQVTGKGGVPSAGVSAVVLNVTVTDTSAGSDLTVWPAGVAQPPTSNLNWAPGVTIPNRVIVAVGTGGIIDIFNFSGNADVIVDVNGWITDNTSTAGVTFTGSTPTRIMDTRAASHVGPYTTPFLGNVTRSLTIAGDGTVPANATGVVLNVTVTDTTAASYLTVFPGDLGSPPVVSDLNWAAGRTIPNLVVVKLGSNGAINLYNLAGSTDVVVDVVGWYS